MSITTPPTSATGPSAGVFLPVEREQSIRLKTRGSLERFQRAAQALAGGVSSAMRRNVRPYPLFFSHGAGSRVVDVDGNSYLDYGLAWGPLILGHAPPAVNRAVAAQLQRGLTFGAQHDLEIEVAERLVSIIPCADTVCFANTGTEIVQLALRLARAATGRHGLLKFEGHYHGWFDNLLVSYHPASEEVAAANGNPIGIGLGQIPNDQVVVAQWNDFESVRAAFVSHPQEIAAVICEPMLCNSGCIPPEPGFLEFLREITTEQGALLIFDEVITGFRVHLQGAQGLYNVIPDLATYAKALGAGAVVSALAGKAQFMDLIATGRVLHAGTMNGNPVSLAAANAALDILSSDDGAVLTELRRRGERLKRGLEAILRVKGHQVVAAGDGAVFHLSFMQQRARNYRELMKADSALYSNFALALLDEGVLVLPDGRWYISTAHTDADIDATLAAAERAVL